MLIYSACHGYTIHIVVGAKFLRILTGKICMKIFVFKISGLLQPVKVIVIHTDIVGFAMTTLPYRLSGNYKTSNCERPEYKL